MTQILPRRTSFALGSKEQPWRQTQLPQKMGPRTVDNLVGKLLQMLYTEARGNVFNARLILQKLLVAVKLEVRFVPNVESTDKMVVDGCIMDGIKQFYQHHNKGGTFVTETQDAVNATLTAACFASKKANRITIQAISDRLGIRWNTVEKNHKQGIEIRESGETVYRPYKPQHHADCYCDEATACVDKLCHSEESSKVDTDLRRV